MGAVRRGGGGSGAQGPAGPRGPTGPAGAPGAPGADGEAGTKFITYTGTARTDGPTPTQADGAQPGDLALNRNGYGLWRHSSERAWVFLDYLKGADGADGTDGTAIISYTAGDGVPPTPGQATDAAIDDVAFNTSTGEIWVKTASPNTWARQGDISGPKGDKGDPGAAGPAGPAGPAGAGIDLTLYHTNGLQFHPNGALSSIDKVCGTGAAPVSSTFGNYRFASVIPLTPGRKYMIVVEWQAISAGDQEFTLQLLSGKNGPKFGTTVDAHQFHQYDSFACMEVSATETAALTSLFFGIVGTKSGGGGGYSQDAGIYVYDLTAATPAAPAEARIECRSGAADSTIHTSAQRTDIDISIPPTVKYRSADDFGVSTIGGKQVIVCKKGGRYDVELGYRIRITETPGGQGDGWVRVGLGVKHFAGGDTTTDSYLAWANVHGSQTYNMTSAFLYLKTTIDVAAGGHLYPFLHFDDVAGGTGPNASKPAKWAFEGAGDNRVMVRRVPT